MTDKVAESICERVAAGESALAVLQEYDEGAITGARKFVQFLNRPGKEKVRKRWTLALASRSEIDLETLRDLTESLWQELSGKDRLGLLKLQWDAMRWVAAKRLPDRYGDTTRNKWSHLTDEELVQLAQEHGIAFTDSETDHSGADFEEAESEADAE